MAYGSANFSGGFNYIDAASGSLAFTLSSAGEVAGAKLHFARIDSVQAPTNTVTISAASGETIAGKLSITLTNLDVVMLVAPAVGGTDWSMIWVEGQVTTMLNKLDCTSANAAILTSGTAYWTYLGRIPHRMATGKVKTNVSVIAVGAQTAECAFATSLYAPDGLNMALTVVGAASWTTALTGLGPNASNPAVAAIPAGSHLWVGIRTAMATTQPTLLGTLGGEDGCGYNLTTAAAGVLAAGPYTGTVSVLSPFPRLSASISLT